MKKFKKVLLSIGITILVMTAAGAIYLGDFYHADMERIEQFVCENKVEMQVDKKDYLIFEPEQAKKGFIF